jgi:hypothetical protein
VHFNNKKIQQFGTKILTLLWEILFEMITNDSKIRSHFDTLLAIAPKNEGEKKKLCFSDGETQEEGSTLCRQETFFSLYLCPISNHGGQP